MPDQKISADPVATDLVNAIFAIVQGGNNKQAPSSLLSFWSLVDGGTFTGPITMVGSSVNTLKLQFNGLGESQINGAGIWLVNSTAATAGLDQYSPSITFEGQAWKTDAVAASQSVRFILYGSTDQNTDKPYGQFRLDASINNETPTSIVSIQRYNGGSYIGFGKQTGSEITQVFIGNTGNGSSGLFSLAYCTLSNNVIDFRDYNGNIGARMDMNNNPKYFGFYTPMITVGNLTPGQINGIVYSGITSHLTSSTFTLSVIDGASDGVGLIINNRSQAVNNRIWWILGNAGDLAICSALDDSTTTVRLNIKRDGEVQFTAGPKFGVDGTGGGSALLGANCPAATVGAPYKWITAKSSDGSTVYIPAWK